MVRVFYWYVYCTAADVRQGDPGLVRFIYELKQMQELWKGLPAGPPTVSAAAACREGDGRGGEGLLRCSRCKTAFFCGPMCQRQGWQRH